MERKPRERGGKRILRTKLISPYSDSEIPINIVLRNRGIEAPEYFFNLDWNDVESPKLLDNIEIAAEWFINTVQENKSIAVICDCDMDGFASSAVLTNYVYKTFPNFNSFTHLFHEKKVHGLDDTTTMKQLRDEIKPQLLIIPDASGSDKQYKALTDLGIKIIVLDHHAVEKAADNESLIVVNNRLSENYENKELTGVGVVWQFCRLLDEILEVDNADNYMDIVALGLIADVCDMRSYENRFIINTGLETENIRSSFLEHCLFIDSFRLKDKLTPTNIAFNIAPLFNAICRVGTIEEKEMLFNSLVERTAKTSILSGNRNKKGQEVSLVVEAYRIATNAKSRQTRRMGKLTENIERVIQEECLNQDSVIIITVMKGDFDESDRDIAGLACNKMQDTYGKPVIVTFENTNGTFSGSCRAPSSLPQFQNFRKQCADSGLTIYSSGQPLAFGVCFTLENSMKLVDYFNDKYSKNNSVSEYACDFFYKADDPILNSTIENLSQYKSVWGKGVEEPLICINDVKINKLTLEVVGVSKGKPTLKFHLASGAVAIKFFSFEEEYHSLLLDDPNEHYLLTIVGTADVNEFRGKTTPQILIKDYDIQSVGYDF